MENIVKKSNYRRVSSLAGIFMASAVLASCSSDETQQEESTLPVQEQVQESESVEAPTLEDDDARYNVMSPNKDAVEKLNKEDDEVKDKWYAETVRESGYEDSQSELISLREDVCKMLESDTTFRNISKELSNRGIEESQQGTIISASMTSKCQDETLKVRKDLLQENEQ